MLYTIDQLKNEKIAIHCPTKQDFDRLMKWFEENNIKWIDGDKATDNGVYVDYKNNTSVDINEFEGRLGYASKQLFIDYDYKIITVSELFQDEKIWINELSNITRENMKGIWNNQPKEDKMTEKIPEYDGYLISSNGQIYSSKNRIIKELKPEITNCGYLRVVLSRNNKAKKFSIHRLVAQVFIPNPENKLQVNHINGVKTDNRVENLEWATQSENMQHAIKVLKRKLGINVKVRCIDTGVIFNSIIEAHRFYTKKSGNGNISEVCKGRRKTALGKRWEIA